MVISSAPWMVSCWLAWEGISRRGLTIRSGASSLMIFRVGPALLELWLLDKEDRPPDDPRFGPRLRLRIFPPPLSARPEAPTLWPEDRPRPFFFLPEALVLPGGFLPAGRPASTVGGVAERTPAVMDGVVGNCGPIMFGPIGIDMDMGGIPTGGGAKGPGAGGMAI